MLRLPAIATAVIAAVVLTWWTAAWLAGERKLAGIAPEARGHYRISLDFAPERFHQVRLQEAGRLVEVRGDSAYMMDVAPAALRGIAREYWVREIARWEGR